MGATLYINAIFQPIHDKYEPKFYEALRARDCAKSEEEIQKAQDKVECFLSLMRSEGYFHDDYNRTSIFWRIQAWSQFLWDMSEEDGLVSAKDVKILKDMLEPASINYPKPIEGETEEGIRKYFDSKKAELLKFLDLAVQHEQAIACSL